MIEFRVDECTGGLAQCRWEWLTDGYVWLNRRRELSYCFSLKRSFHLSNVIDIN